MLFCTVLKYFYCSRWLSAPRGYFDGFNFYFRILVESTLARENLCGVVLKVVPTFPEFHLEFPLELLDEDLKYLWEFALSPIGSGNDGKYHGWR